MGWPSAVGIWNEKKRVCLCAAVAALTGAAALPAGADPVLTTGAYKAACGLDNPARAAFCEGYVKAAMDFAQVTGRSCIPADMPAPDMVIAVEAFAFERIGTEGFPEDQAAIAMVLAIINNMFPCDR